MSPDDFACITRATLARELAKLLIVAALSFGALWAAR